MCDMGFGLRLNLTPGHPGREEIESSSGGCRSCARSTMGPKSSVKLLLGLYLHTQHSIVNPIIKVLKKLKYTDQ